MMSTTELKAIEILLNSLTSKNSTMSVPASDIDSFTNSKLNLFNIITINTLIKYYEDTPLFSKEQFLKNGTIPNVYQNTVESPALDLSYENNPDLFYGRLLEALKNNQYYFDNEGNICITHPELETSIFPIWLHRLAETMKDLRYKNVFLFNKNKDAKIYDEQSLLTYLNQSKTFFVTLTNLPNVNMEETFSKLKRKTTNTVAQKDVAKVDDIIFTLKEYTPEELLPQITKFIIPSPVYIVKRANSLGQTFYNAPLNIQNEYISAWLTEYILANDLAAASLQKVLLVKDTKQLSTIPHEEKQRAICGLHNVLFTVLDHSDVDFDTISLSDFQIETYLSEKHQETQVTLNEIIGLLDATETSKELKGTQKKISELMDEINKLDSTRDRKELDQKQVTINALFDKYRRIELGRESLIDKRNSLQNVLHYHKEHDIDDLNFDNPKIAALIKKAVVYGQVHINPLDNRKVSIKLINPQTGKTTFVADIKIKDLLKFVEDLNFQLEESEFQKAS